MPTVADLTSAAADPAPTVAGLTLVALDLVPTVVDLLNMALVDFTHDEASTLTRLLKKLIDGVDAVPACKAEELEHQE